MNFEVIESIIIIFFSAIVHEVSHGLVAEKLGDETARREGRITLNPIPHIDPVGTILLPIVTAISSLGSFVIGSAKPVPVNYSNFKNPNLGMVLVSLAGPLSNVLLAVLFVLPIKLGVINEISGPILVKAIYLNLMLAVFNLIPVPPLDGSKIVAGFLPRNLKFEYLELERFGFIIILLLVFVGVLSFVLTPVVNIFFKIFNLI